MTSWLKSLWTRRVYSRLCDAENSLTVDQVPLEFREPYILTGYRRPSSSISACLRSLFYMNNNESVNFWTHFLPFVYTFYQLVKISVNYNSIYNDDFVWPLFIYLFTSSFYLLVSSMAHALNCMSPIARHLLFIMDYLSISMYGMGSSIGKALFISLSLF
jgi:predicted membrane channel-forming protein YqfA (hemolysin III family)